MYFLKCKFCGASLTTNENDNIIRCTECNKYNTLASSIDERKASLIDRANQLRQARKFDRAISVCQQLLSENEKDAEIYWLILLCKYGVNYVVDNVTGNRMPVIDTRDYKSIFSSDEFKRVLELADDSQKEIYNNEAQIIDDVATGKIKVALPEQPEPIKIEPVEDQVEQNQEDTVKENEEPIIDVIKEQQSLNEPVIDNQPETETENVSKKRGKLPVTAIVAVIACIAVAVIVAIVGIVIKNSSKPTVNESLASVGIGDSFLFGTYEQDCDASSKEPIEWIVLKKEDGCAMLISKYGLDAVPYNTISESITWEKSSIRKWLNNDFFNEAFTEEERAMIPSVDVRNPGNPEYSTYPGNHTVDKVFFLDVYEADELFESDESRILLPTQYAITKSAYVHDGVEYAPECAGNTYWWLRAPGDDGQFAAIIDYDGRILHFGLEVEYAKVAIRPVICLYY